MNPHLYGWLHGDLGSSSAQRQDRHARRHHPGCDPALPQPARRLRLLERAVGRTSAKHGDPVVTGSRSHDQSDSNGIAQSDRPAMT
jgi:hypothetical protein